MPRGHQAGPVHHVAEDEAVADADDDAGTEVERPLLQGDEGVADGREGGAVGAGGAGEVLSHGHEREDG